MNIMKIQRQDEYYYGNMLHFSQQYLKSIFLKIIFT